MKQWLGKIERAVLWSLTEIRGCVELSIVVRFVFHGNENMTLDECLSLPQPTRSQYNTVNRAVASLERKGHVRTSTSRDITTRPGPKTVTVVHLTDDAQATTEVTPDSDPIADGLCVVASK